MDDERDAEYAIRKLDSTEFGRKGCRLRIEWTKHERGGRRSDDSKKPPANTKPSKTLFVINFDPIHTRTRDLEKHFDEYGKIMKIKIRRNFAFIQYESQEDATKALDATNSSKFIDRVISVEYAVRDDDMTKEMATVLIEGAVIDLPKGEEAMTVGDRQVCTTEIGAIRIMAMS